eukprot:2196968-Prymnesium_polylepis.1
MVSCVPGGRVDAGRAHGRRGLHRRCAHAALVKMHEVSAVFARERAVWAPPEEPGVYLAAGHRKPRPDPAIDRVLR